MKLERGPRKIVELEDCTENLEKQTLEQERKSQERQNYVFQTETYWKGDKSQEFIRKE